MNPIRSNSSRNFCSKFSINQISHLEFLDIWVPYVFNMMSMHKYLSIMFSMPIFYRELNLIPVCIIFLFCIQRKIFIHSDEYATYIRLIDDILEQRYNYVIQSRRTIETFPVKSKVIYSNIYLWISVCYCQISFTRNSSSFSTTTSLSSYGR